jgi:hypothetical protein
MRQLRVATMTIGFKLRLDLAYIRSPEYDIYCRRVNMIVCGNAAI